MIVAKIISVACITNKKLYPVIVKEKKKW